MTDEPEPVDAVRLAELEAENRRLRVALERIAGHNSGRWGWIAHEALTNQALYSRSKGREAV